MADNIDIISDTTGQEIVSKLNDLSMASLGTGQVLFDCWDLYNGAGSIITKEDVTLDLTDHNPSTKGFGRINMRLVDRIYVTQPPNSNKGIYLNNSDGSGKSLDELPLLKISCTYPITGIWIEGYNASGYSQYFSIIDKGGIVLSSTSMSNNSIFYHNLTSGFISNKLYLWARTEDVTIGMISIRYYK